MSHEVYFQEALQYFPGGVNSPVRAFHGAGREHPLFIRSAHKSFVIDENNRCFLDFVLSWGPMIHGHSHPKIVDSVSLAVKKGSSFGAPTRKETTLAGMINSFMPSIEKMRFTSSGTEAAMTAVRIARAATSRPIIIKFQGGYHGHVESLLATSTDVESTNSAVTQHGTLVSAAKMVLNLPYNDINALQQAFNEHGEYIAGVIVEGIAGNMGCVPGDTDFLHTIQNLCREHKAVFILDEVMTGFRVAPGGATELYDLDPDLTLLGKIIGGGFPLAVVGGKKCFIDLLAPQGPVYHAGTLSGNPVAVQAGITTLELLQKEDFYPTLKEKTEHFCQAVVKKVGQYVPISAHYTTGMLSFFNTAQPPKNLQEVQAQSAEHFHLFFDGLLQEEIYWPASLYEACFLSQAHTPEQLEDAARKISLSWLRASKNLLKTKEASEQKALAFS